MLARLVPPHRNARRREPARREDVAVRQVPERQASAEVGTPREHVVDLGVAEQTRPIRFIHIHRQANCRCERPMIGHLQGHASLHAEQRVTKRAHRIGEKSNTSRVGIVVLALLLADESGDEGADAEVARLCRQSRELGLAFRFKARSLGSCRFSPCRLDPRGFRPGGFGLARRLRQACRLGSCSFRPSGLHPCGLNSRGLCTRGGFDPRHFSPARRLAARLAADQRQVAADLGDEERVGLVQVIDHELESVERTTPVPAKVSRDVGASASKRHPLHRRALGQRAHGHLPFGQDALHLRRQRGQTRPFEHSSEVALNRRPRHRTLQGGNVANGRGESGRAAEHPDGVHRRGLLCPRNGCTENKRHDAQADERGGSDG